MHFDLKKKTSLSIGYNAVAKAISLVVQALANIVLTRNLLAQDYGVVGMAAIFFNFISQFNDMGIGSAVVRQKELSRRDLYTAFTVRVSLSCLVFLLSIAVAPVANKIFNNPDVGIILMVYAVNFLVYALNFMPHVMLTRELSYDKLFFSSVGSSLVGSLVAVVLAVAGYGYWSLVFAYLSSSIVQSVITNSIRPIRIRFCFDQKLARHLLSFGTKIGLTGFVSFALLNADNFVIGKVSGVTVLGYYILAFNWGSMICNIITAVVSNALLPVFSLIQDDLERLKNAYLQVLSLMSLVVVGGNMLLLLVSEEFLYLVLGHSSDKWLPSLAALQILCVYGVLSSLIEPGRSVLLSMGVSTVMLRASVVAAIIELGLIYPALKYSGIESVAVVVTVAAASQYLFYLPNLRKYLKVSYSQISLSLLPVLVALGGTVTAALWADRYLGGASWLTFFAKIFLISALYLVLYGTLTNWRILRDVRGLFAVSRASS